MATDDPLKPEVLISVSCESEAAAVVTALASYGIEAFAVGGYTAGFRAEAPSNVNVLVRHADLKAARQALCELAQTHTQFDWSTVDVGAPREG